MQDASKPKECFLEIINPKLHPSLPFMVYIGMCGLEGYGWFLSDFGLKRGMEFDHFRMKYGMTLAWQRASMGLTVRRKTAKNLAVRRKNERILAVSRKKN